jgi:hypothetical protein
MVQHAIQTATGDILTTVITGLLASIGKWCKCKPRKSLYGNREQQRADRQFQVNDKNSKHRKPPCKILFFDSDDCEKRKVVEQAKLMHEHDRFLDKLGSTGLLGHSMDRAPGVVETPFAIDRLSLGLCDIGTTGPFLRRREWAKLFEDVTGIVFVVNLAGYDENLLYDPTQTRLMQSLHHFETMVNSPHLKDTSIDLFMSNAEEFRKKLLTSPLSDYFPDYEGGNDVMKAAKYLLWRYVQLNRANLSIYPHLIGKEATASSEVLFGAVKQMALQSALSEFKLLEKDERRKSKWD